MIRQDTFHIRLEKVPNLFQDLPSNLQLTYQSQKFELELIEVFTYTFNATINVKEIR